MNFDFMQGLGTVSDIGVALLAILGGLKVLTRLTKTEADDKVLDAIEKPIRAAVEFLRPKGK